MAKQLFYVDLLRVFLCIAVVIIHVSGSNLYSIDVRSTEWQILNMYNSLARFCVPVFVMLSGMLLLNPDKPLMIKQLYMKYILRIFITWTFWEIFYAVVWFYWTGQVFSWGACRLIIKTAIEGHHHLWYLPMLLGLYISTPILRALTEKKDKTICKYFILLFFAFCVLKPAVQLLPLPNYFADIVNKIPFTLACGYVGYFMLGYFLSAHPMSKHFHNALYILGIAGAVAAVAVSRLYSIRTDATSGTVYDFFSVPVFFMSIGIFLFFKEQVSKFNFNEKFIKIIHSLSSCSFGIYLIHAFFIERIYNFGLTTLSYNPAFSVPIISIMGFILSWLFVIVIRKIPLAKKYIV